MIMKLINKIFIIICIIICGSCLPCDFAYVEHYTITPPPPVVIAPHPPVIMYNPPASRPNVRVVVPQQQIPNNQSRQNIRKR